MSSGAAAQPFDVTRFQALRQERGLGWGAPLVYMRSTGSTNDDALAAARSSGASGSVFLADHQTQGRGRRGKTWVAAPGQHLLFSILLREATATGVGALTLAVGLGVREALAARAGTSCPKFVPMGHSALGPSSTSGETRRGLRVSPTGAVLAVPLRLKWPNDVLAGTRKLAGILCEGHFVGSRLEAVVIGIGINVLSASYPPELEGQVACLEALAANGTPLERERLLVEVLAAVEAHVRAYLADGFGALLDEFIHHDALAGERVEVSGAAPIVGVARGVDVGGRLLVESDGLIVPVISGTVRALGR